MYDWQIENFFEICKPCVDNFKGVFAADEIPELRNFEVASIVVNTNTRAELGQYGHWLALYYQGVFIGEKRRFRCIYRENIPSIFNLIIHLI
ncbi:hypothetical protein TNCV_3018481 [Trichonephila clavipes]|nr:hypothetical protein TNCV_3018481 [Trichonephila clavipes]